MPTLDQYIRKIKKDLDEERMEKIRSLFQRGKLTRAWGFLEEITLTDTLTRVSPASLAESLALSETLTNTTCTAFQIETDSPPNCAIEIGLYEVGLGA